MYNYQLIQHKAHERFKWSLAIFWVSVAIAIGYLAYDFLQRFNWFVSSALK